MFPVSITGEFGGPSAQRMGAFTSHNSEELKNETIPQPFWAFHAGVMGLYGLGLTDLNFQGETVFLL